MGLMALNKTESPFVAYKEFWQSTFTQVMLISFVGILVLSAAGDTMYYAVFGSVGSVNPWVGMGLLIGLIVAVGGTVVGLFNTPNAYLKFAGTGVIIALGIIWLHNNGVVTWTVLRSVGM